MNRLRRANLFLLIGWAAMSLAACTPGTPVSTSTPVPSPTVFVTSTPVSEPVTQAAMIAGIWQGYSPHCDRGYMLIHTDGTYTWSCNADGSDGLSGKFWFDNDHFMLKNDICPTPGEYDVRLVQGNDQSKELNFAVVKDDCAANVNTLTKQPIVWVSGLP